MPFLRVLRDKRGYETIYLMHWFREGTRHRSRILYMFRTPGGVRVGRIALEPETIRQIEAQHPDIEFDWNAVRETQQVIEPPPDFRRRRPRRDSPEGASGPDEGAGGSDEARETAPPPHEATRPAPPAPPPPPAPTPVSATAPPVATAAPRPLVPSAIEGQTPDEQMAFLLHWHPLICERLVQRTADPERRDALLALAERLNPATWIDADQITAGLQQASEALERLSRVMSRRRRRARRPSGNARQVSPGAPDPSDSGAES